MQTLDSQFEYLKALEEEQSKQRAKMIDLVKNKLFGFLEENELNLVIDYMNYSEKLNTTYSDIVLTLENTFRVLNHSEIEKVSEMAIKIDKDISNELNQTYKETTVKSYIDGIIGSIKSDKQSKEGNSGND